MIGMAASHVKSQSRMSNGATSKVGLGSLLLYNDAFKVGESNTLYLSVLGHCNTLTSRLKRLGDRI